MHKLIFFQTEPISKMLNFTGFPALLFTLCHLYLKPLDIPINLCVKVRLILFVDALLIMTICASNLRSFGNNCMARTVLKANQFFLQLGNNKLLD